MSTLNSPGSSSAEVSPGLAMAQLETILASETFRNSVRLGRFLRYVVEQSLEGAKTLKEREIGVEVFDREDGYDTRADPVVRVEARQLRFKLADYYAKEGASDEILIHLPKGGYAASFERRPVAMAPVQADVERVEIESATASGPESFARRRVWIYVGSVVLCAAGAWVGARSLSKVHPQAAGNAASIAVLPFTNRSANPANQYLADGLTEEITDLLARNRRLRVAARSSASQFKAKPGDLGELGRKLNVANVLEGSIERSGDQVKIIARMKRVSDGAFVWSNTYERPLSDLFAVQSEMASGIAGKLAGGAGIPVIKHVPNPAAHDFVMKGRFDLQRPTTQSVTQAEADFQHAISVDPDYAVAYVWLARANLAQAIARGSIYRTEMERNSAEELSRKALQIDPDLPEAHAVLADLAMQYEWDWSTAERELLLALSGPPSAKAELSYAFFLIFHHRFGEADLHLRRAQELEPFDTSTMLNLSQAWYLEGRFAQVQEISERVLAIYPAVQGAQAAAAGSYIWEGQPERALAALERIKKPFPALPFYEAMARARAGQREEALRLIRPFEERYPNCGVALQWIAKVHAMTGDENNTVKWMERSADSREWQALNLAVNPVFASMENSPGFRALKKRMGLER